MPNLHTDLSIGTVGTAPSPATSGTSLIVTDAVAANLPNVYPWYAVVKPSGTAPTRSNSEIIKVTGGSSSAGNTTYTIVRAQGLPVTTARSIIAGDDIYECVASEVQAGAADNTIGDVSTSTHGFAPKAVAPAANVLNVLGIANGETAISNKAIFDATNPAALGTAAPGTSLIAAHRDHVHAIPTLDGWIPTSDSWSYLSANTVTVPSGAASLYGVGDRVKFTQTTVKYFAITAVADTTLTFAVNTDYTVANAAISAISYSHEASPVGYPHYFAYTITWSTGGTQPAVGNGTLTGRLKIIGREATMVMELIMGSTTTFGTDTWRFSLPVTAANKVVDYQGSAYALDSGTAFWIGTALTTPAGTYAQIAPNNSGAYYNATAPFTWAVNDECKFTLKYEI